MVNVKDLGAIGNAETDDTLAFQKALESGDELVIVPAGQYLISSTLYIDSNTKLHAHPKAEIKLMDYTSKKRGDFLITNKHWNGEGDCNIEIRGGIWNGNNATNHKPQDKMYDDAACSGAIMNFKNVKNLVVSSLDLCDAGGYNTRFCHVNGFIIENIRFTSLNPMANNDGIHLNGFVENGVIRNIVGLCPGSTSDDMIAMNADDIITRCEALDMECGYIRNIVIDGVHAERCQSFIRILSINSDITNITVSNVTGGFWGLAVNMDGARYCMTPIIDPNSPEYTKGVGCVENVTLNHFNVHNLSVDPDSRYMRLESNMKNFRIFDFKRNDKMEMNHGTQTMLMRYISPSDVKIRGIDADCADKFLGKYKDKKVTYTDINSETVAGADFETDYDDSFTLESGNISYLEINQK